MSIKFYGYASAYSIPDKDCDVFVPGCFTAFLEKPEHLSIPMRNGHDLSQPSMGRWLKMSDTGFGLLVFGEMNEGFSLPKPYPGLSIRPENSQGSAHKTLWGGKLCRVTDIAEISLVESPAHVFARVLGELD
jgi:hypothetical protein